MNISRLENILQFFKASTKKTEKTDQVSPELNPAIDATASQNIPDPENDSVSLTAEGIIKTAAMQVKTDLTTVHEEKLNEIKDKIASGQYQVNPEDIARAIVRGRDVYGELM